MIELVMVLRVGQVEFFDDAELRFFVKRFMRTVENAKLFEVRKNGNRHPAREPVAFHLKDRVLIFRKVDEGFLRLYEKFCLTFYPKTVVGFFCRFLNARFIFILRDIIEN
jgi:hypothetical protein